MNLLVIAGRLGRDAELRRLPGEKSVLNFSVAVDEYRGAGEKGVLWFDCALWGDRAEKLAQYLVKGVPVSVSGRVGLRQYETRDGKASAALTLRVNDVTLLGSKADRADYDWKAAEQKASAERPETRPAVDEPNDEIPF